MTHILPTMPLKVGDIALAMRSKTDHEASIATSCVNHGVAVRNALAAIQARFDADHLRKVANEYRVALSLIAEGSDAEVMRLVAHTVLMIEEE